MYVSSGGTANDTTVNAGYLYVSSGGMTNGTTVNSNGGLIVLNGGVANNTTVSGWGHPMYVYSGGVANCTTVNKGGLYIYGGKLTGKLTAATKTEVYLGNGSIADFNISVVSPGSAALINDWSLVKDDGAFYTITISETQAVGVYSLADGAAGFDKSITVNTDSGAKLGVITVGSSLKCGNGTFTLINNGQTLFLTVADGVTVGVPEVLSVIADITAPTNENVTVMATYSSDTVLKQYSLDSKTWNVYTSGIVMNSNGTIYFRGIDAAGNISDVTSYTVTNIKTGGTPVTPTSASAKPTAKADVTKPTNKNVTVTATYSSDTVIKQYSLDNATWQDYTAGVTMSDNGTVYFRGIDSAGNVSDITLYKVSCIDRTAPIKPIAMASTKEVTNQSVTVAASFSLDSTVKQYSLDNTTWQSYTGGVTMSKNGTVYFRGIDAAGNISAVTSYTVNNIVTTTDLSANGVVFPGDDLYLTPNLPASGLYKLSGFFAGKKGTVIIVSNGKKIASTTVKNGIFNLKKELLLDSRTPCLIIIKNTDKKSGGADFSGELTAKELFTQGDNSDNIRTGAKTLAAGSPVNDWIGYGDAVDYWKLGVDAQGGFYDLSISGVRNNVKLTVYAADGRKIKGVTASAKKPSLALAGLCLANGSYAVVEAPKAAKAQNSDYKLTLTQKATFTGMKNNGWSSAEVLKKGATFTGALTKAPGGDMVDYCDVSKIDSLYFDMKAGKTKVSFYDAQYRPVKVTAVGLANGSGKANVASLTLAANNATTDHFTIAAIDDAVKYLKIEASGKTLNSYSITKIA